MQMKRTIMFLSFIIVLGIITVTPLTVKPEIQSVQLLDIQGQNLPQSDGKYVIPQMEPVNLQIQTDWHKPFELRVESRKSAFGLNGFEAANRAGYAIRHTAGSDWYIQDIASLQEDQTYPFYFSLSDFPGESWVLRVKIVDPTWSSIQSKLIEVPYIIQ